MKNEELFEAIGGLDDSMLAECKNTVERRTGRMGWKAVLIAAVLTGLAVTAVAAPLIHNALKGGKVETDNTVWWSPTDPADGASYELREHRITLDVEFDADAPKAIKTYYIPQIPENLQLYHGHIYKDSMSAQFGWKGDGYIFFSQEAGGSLLTKELVEYVFTVPGDAPDTGLRTFSGIEGYLIRVDAVGDEQGEQIFYWSDGAYLFRLEVPLDYTDAQLEALVTSVQPVEDITPYLCTMTEQEVKDFFG